MAAGGGDRFSLPGAGRVRGAGRGVVLRPRGGHRPGAGPDVTAPGGRGAAGGVGGVGGGQVVAAAGGGAAADPGGWAGGRAGRGVRGRVWCSPRPGRRWMSWRCGWRCWREPTRPRCGGGWTPRRRGSPSPRGRPPWRGHPGRPGMGMAPRRRRPALAAAPVAAGGRPVRGAVHPVRRGGAAAGVHHRAARGRHRRARPGSGTGRGGGAGGARRLRGPVRRLPAAGRARSRTGTWSRR